MSVMLGQIPELIQALSKFADSKTSVALMLSCKGFFNILAPLVWEMLKGSEIVFSLIAGAKITVLPTSMTICIDLPDPVSEAALERLKLYAPYIKHLELCKKSGYDYKISNWNALLNASWHSPLLPNITVLTLGNPAWCAMRGGAQLPMMLMFLSPSLLEFRITWELRYHITMLSKPRVEAILYALQQQCPNLHTLVLFSDLGTEFHEEERRLLPIEYDISGFFQAVSLRLLSLSLSTVDSISDPSLISRVEKLSIHYKNSCGSFRTLTVPGLQWPNLSQLSVYSVHKVECLRYLWDTPALVSKLETVVIHFRDQCFPDHSIGDSIGPIVAMLARGSPKLKTLWLVRRGMRGSFTNPGTLIQVLSHLSLREVRIGAARLESPPAIDVQQTLAGRVFDSVERLEVGRHRVYLRDLQHYVRSFPNLKHIRIQIDLSSEALNYDAENLPTSLTECHLHISGVVSEGPTFEPVWTSSSRFVVLFSVRDLN
ncbi:hypothetical protein FRC10_010251 [Ceratobasidium sp. 414]|nr:hypothetical protein FRC10_010251 [Ceratobasidium sp. 414]